MKKLAIITAALLFVPTLAQAQEYSPLQRYLFDQSGYAPPELGYDAQPQPVQADSYNTAYVDPYATEYDDSESSEPVIMSLEDL